MARPHHAAGGAPCCSDASIDAPTQEARVRPLALTARSRMMATSSLLVTSRSVKRRGVRCSMKHRCASVKLSRCSEDFAGHSLNLSQSKTFNGVGEK